MCVLFRQPEIPEFEHLMWDGFNKRKFPRISLRCEITILADGRSSPIVTLTENLGVGGVCVILDQPLDRFSKCRVRLDLDDKLPEIECNGKVVWNVKTTETKGHRLYFDTGIEFENLEPPVSERLRQYLGAQPQVKATS